MGIYANKVKSVEEFPQGATIAIPNDTANEARALTLLQSAKLIKLKPDFDPVKGRPMTSLKTLKLTIKTNSNDYSSSC